LAAYIKERCLMGEFLMKPRIDFAFKEIMRNEKARLGFLSAVLKLRPEDIKKTQILNVELRREHAEDKQGILDVHILLNNEVEIDVEVQLVVFLAWADRSLFYLAKMLTNQLHPGDTYSKIGKCVNISILDFKLFPEVKEFHSCFHLWEDTRRQLYTDKLEFHILELPKLPEELQEDAGALLLWAKFLSGKRKEDFEAVAERDPYVKEAYRQLRIISQDQRLRWEYEAREKAVRDQAQLMWEAEQRAKQGYDKGMAKGRAEGRAEGIAGIVAMSRKIGFDFKQTVAQVQESIPSLSLEEIEAQVKAIW